MKNKNIPTHKICSKCGENKPLEEFGNRKDSKDGKKGICKECTAIRKKQDYEDNKEEILVKRKQYREDRKEEIAIKKKQDYEKHKEEILIKKKQCYKDRNEDQKEADVIKNKQHYEEHKEEEAIRSKQYREDNKEELAIKAKQRRQTPAGKEITARIAANRKRDLGYIPLNERPDQSDNWRGHHVDYEHIIYIPTEIHITNSHQVRGINAGRGMDEINELAFEYLFDNTDGLVVPIEFVVELRDSLLN